MMETATSGGDKDSLTDDNRYLPATNGYDEWEGSASASGCASNPHFLGHRRVMKMEREVEGEALFQFPPTEMVRETVATGCVVRMLDYGNLHGKLRREDFQGRNAAGSSDGGRQAAGWSKWRWGGRKREEGKARGWCKGNVDARLGGIFSVGEGKGGRHWGEM